MRTKLPTSDADMSNGDAAFLTPPSIRQPANPLGPRAQRTINRIIEATRDVFLTRGYSGTTIDEIARLADVSRASFYTYFPSKRDVLIASVRIRRPNARASSVASMTSARVATG